MEKLLKIALVFAFGMLLMLIILSNVRDNSVYKWGWEESEKNYYKTGQLKYEWKKDSTFVEKSNRQ